MRLITVFSSELEPSDEEEELYRFSPVPEHEADIKAAKLKTTVDKLGDEVVEDSSDDDTDSEQDEMVNLRGIIRKLTEDNAKNDHIISELRRENKEKNATISELRRRITKHPQTTTPGFGFEGISTQFDKDHLEHENVTLQTKIGGMLIEKDIVKEKLEVVGDIINDFVTHTVTQTHQMIDGLTRMLTIQLDKDNLNHRNVAYFSCTIRTILHTKKSDIRAVLLDTKLHCVFENIRQHGTRYYRYLVFPINSSGDKLLKITLYHWTVLFFNIRKKNWMHYNSLRKRDGKYPFVKDATFVKKYVENYMKDRHAKLKNQSTGT
ncbi:hypothetical protein RHSIM_Rhsim02G0150000 [Rhododendron simsii]|uniref:Uncharacterized protein n=1 Tax=Rhododendron simsii TaxID=118357 RepID=A0A834HG64_RHOSS|nr:hypothetical protein RHSIM_Rhsim02G0150000 [Rhododendron simsii]